MQPRLGCTTSVDLANVARPTSPRCERCTKGQTLFSASAAAAYLAPSVRMYL